MEKVMVKGEFILQLESKQDWINRVPKALPEKWRKPESWLWVDAMGNNIAIGEDFAAAESLKSYPIRVYRLQRAAEILNPNLSNQ